MENIVVDSKLDARFTSWHTVTITVNPMQISELLGTDSTSDGYKVSRSWNCSFKGNVFTVYDWKETDLYNSNRPSEQDFWSQDLVTLHIGSRVGAAYEVEFVNELLLELSKIEIVDTYPSVRSVHDEKILLINSIDRLSADLQTTKGAFAREIFERLETLRRCLENVVRKEVGGSKTRSAV